VLSEHLTSTDFNRYVGRQLKMARLHAGHSQEELGQLLGLTFQQIQKYEKGLNKISLENLWRLCHVLGVEIASFLPDPGDASPAAGGNRSSERLRLEIGRAVQNISSAPILRNVLNIVKSLAETAG
jgi:transcriptional regulator with XRE-family HTH domain